MTSPETLFLPGVPAQSLRAALARAGGNEIESGKLESAESSAALAVNAFGWFLDRPETLPLFPGLEELDWPPVRVDVEREMRFPWKGGRHPWLDAAVETGTHLIGVESKRFEPFRDAKRVALSDAYDRDVWGPDMGAFTSMRDRLRSAPGSFIHLDAAQLLKHAFGLVTEARRVGKRPILLYLFAEPAKRGAAPITAKARAAHREEIADFGAAIAGAEVSFAACSYREWLARWTGEALLHASALTQRYEP